MIDFNWTEKVQGADYINAEDVNALARAITLLNEEMGKKVQTPKIADNGNWLLWDPKTKEYVDSGIFAQGPEGPKGEKGDKGDKGDSGEPGYTPQKGVDYFTQEEIAGLDIPKYNSATLLAMYNEVDITPSPEEWFNFDKNAKTITSLNSDYQTEIEEANELIIPYTINGVMVENIGSGGRLDANGENVQNIKKVRLPNSIKSIGKSCFYSWDMEDINLPTSCSYIGEMAFSWAGNLKQVITPIRPNWELEIGGNVFEFSGLDNIDNLLDGIKVIPSSAFLGNMFLSTITVPESVERIDEDGLQPQYGEISVLTILNKNCVLNHPFQMAEYVSNENPDFPFPRMIKGYSGSTAEVYAKEWNIPFVSIEGTEFATKDEVGDIETALDNIIAIQETLIGGESV